jgi:hypothetical protein
MPNLRHLLPAKYSPLLLGVFLDTQGRRVFIPANCTLMPSQSFKPGETVTIQVFRRFAEQEGLA